MPTERPSPETKRLPAIKTAMADYQQTAGLRQVDVMSLSQDGIRGRRDPDSITKDLTIRKTDMRADSDVWQPYGTFG